MNYQRVILVGNATADARRRTSKKGDVKYTTFNVGVQDTKGRSTFFPVSVFGELGATMAKYVTKGKQVVVEGRIEVDEKHRFNIVGERIQLGAQRDASAK